VTDVTGDVHPAPDGNFYILTRELRKFFTDSYLGGADPVALPYLSPVRAGDLSGLPPALVITGEYDPLCTQGKTLADRYRDSGTSVIHTCYQGAIHGFMTFPVPMRALAVEEVSGWLQALLTPSSSAL
jgi:acetyl esterase